MTETEKMAVMSALNKRSAGTLMDLLGIEFIDVGDNFLTVKMTITPQTHQPAGIMHGGVSVVLGETAGSCLSNLLLGEGQHAVGCDITAHHLRPVRAGTVYCTARLRRKGRTMHYSEMEVSDEQGRLVCAMSMSNMVVAARE